MPQTELLRHLYAGIRSAPPFGAFLLRLVRALGADHGYLVIENGGHSRLCCQASAATGIMPYHPPPALALDRIPFGMGLSAAEVGGIEHLLHRAGVCPHILGIDSAPPPRRMRLRLLRDGANPAFDAVDKAVLCSLNRHLDEASGLWVDLLDHHQERDLLRSSLDRIALGHLVVDQDLRLISATPKGTEIALRQGLLCVEKRHLHPSHPTDPLARALALMFRASAHHHGATGHAISLIGVDGTMLFATLRHCRPADGPATSPRAQVSLSLREAYDGQGPSAARLALLFGPTPAEASLSACMAHGYDLEEVSRRLNISKNTAKSQLRMVFQKTGASRQSQLLRIIWQAVDEVHSRPAPAQGGFESVSYL